MPTPQQQLENAFAAYQRGDFTQARAGVVNVRHPKALHLLGMIARREGKLDEAAVCFERAAGANPQDVEVANHQGLLCQQLGDLPGAAAAFRRALTVQDNYLPAQLGLGRVLIEQESFDQAQSVFSQCVVQAPDNERAQYGLATAQLALGSVEQAENTFDRLLTHALHRGDDQAQIRFMRGRSRLELGAIDAAREDLTAAYSMAPDAMSLRALAQVLWMTAATDDFDRLVEDAVNGNLGLVAVELVRQTGDADRALALLARLPANEQETLDCMVATAWVQVDREMPQAARDNAERALELHPRDPGANAVLITACLMLGDPRAALTLAQNMQTLDPDRQHWIAYEHIAARLLGVSDDASLDGLIRTYSLPIPEGYRSIADFNRDLLAVVDSLQPFTARPLDQSLRRGTQTHRNLATLKEPVLTAYRQALHGPIADYLTHLGNDSGHPCARRNTGSYTIADCWSVTLTGGGHHVNHVHPNGWISSAYYACVPDSVGVYSRDGWIKFAEPPFPTQPMLDPLRWLRPEPGVLVLFPSYLWHGTQPIADGGVRVSVPFDVLPV